MVTLNPVVALAMAHGPEPALSELAAAEAELAGHYRVDAVRAHLSGDGPGARANYERAAARTPSEPERRYLTARAARLVAEQPVSGRWSAGPPPSRTP